MKNFFRFMALLFPIIILGVGNTAVAKDADSGKQKLKYARSVVIAKKDKDGNPEINTDVLVKKFKDGGEIKQFEIKKLAVGIFLLRIGVDAHGQSKTDVIPLRKTRDGLKLKIRELKKISTCFAPECEGGFCRPNDQNNNCLCNEATECKFGINTELELFDVIISP